MPKNLSAAVDKALAAEAKKKEDFAAADREAARADAKAKRKADIAAGLAAVDKDQEAQSARVEVDIACRKKEAARAREHGLLRAWVAETAVHDGAPHGHFPAFAHSLVLRVEARAAELGLKPEPGDLPELVSRLVDVPMFNAARRDAEELLAKPGCRVKVILEAAGRWSRLSEGL